MKKLVFTNQQSETFNKFKLCVIIPFRYQESRSDFEERLLYPMMDKKIPDSVCFFVVDDGSKKEYSAKE